MNNREYITRTWLCFFVWVSSWSQHTGGLRYKSSLRHQDLVYVHVAEVLELVVSKWTMGWDGMGHRGLRNKWPGLPVAMLFPVFGSIEHLNELEQRNIGIRRWSRLFSPEPNRAFDFSIIRPCFSLSLSFFFRDSYFVEFEHFRRIIGSWLRFCYAESPPDFDEINFLPFQPCLHSSFLRNFFLRARFTSSPDEKWELDSLWI